MTTEATGQPKKKVVVIGGGVSGMVAAMALTEPSMGGAYDVTVYQMGWRLGGKGASGRNAGDASRIEEHGLHIWFGFYDNAFTWMRHCYDELNRQSGPLRTLDEALKPQDYFIFTEPVGNEWREWLLDCPRNSDQPGGYPSILDSIDIVLGWISQLLKQALTRNVTVADAHLADIHLGAQAEVSAWGFVDRLSRRLNLNRPLYLHEVVDGLRRHHSPMDVLAQPGNLADKARAELLAWLARALWAVIGVKVLAGNDEARRLWVLAYCGLTTLRGILADSLWYYGYDHANGETFHDWMARHAPLPADTPGDPNRIAFYSAPIRAFFDAAFAFADGDTDKPNMAAGVAIRGMQRIALGYKGAIVYEMQAGMGDTVFTPFYQLLSKRGVKFEFFARAGDVELATDGKSIKQMKIHHQVKLKNGYDPLVVVNELACWPDRPLYDQIVDGDKLRDSGADLSHYSSGWQDQGPTTELAAGINFDHVILAAALPSLPEICPDVISAMPRWQDMLAHVTTTRTQAFQLWMTKSREEIGLPGPPAVVGAYVEPWSSITDFTHLLPMECWPAEAGVKFLTYSCGVMPITDPSGQKEADDLVFRRVTDFLQNNARGIWPGTMAGNNFDWSVLVAPASANGPDRLKCQYWRANVDSTELFILSTRDGIGHRIKAGGTGLANLVFAGDWTDNGFNIGSVEGAVRSGLQAARAVSGAPIVIFGENGA
jgi:uncharacterized protein with NAD-binding domain and iron-sulfur cluster